MLVWCSSPDPDDGKLVCRRCKNRLIATSGARFAISSCPLKDFVIRVYREAPTRNIAFVLATYHSRDLFCTVCECERTNSGKFDLSLCFIITASKRERRCLSQ